ncbi:dTDP-4-dehydrorhamnose reductase family protein [Thalassotalea sediminis]|uniref:dTDP-4-dehydrorhamnose reductase family protein n=1 Tax=Thalassotalea sediminis TaxID=1759089 RepID=UPI002573AE99|nr:SDR family oxidoreductase [Thalassotalea sediminis]
MKRVMITGATGLLGRALVKTLSQSFQVIGTGFTRAKPPILPLDLQNEEAVSTFIELHQPDVIIHAAAERKPDICETDHQATINLNVNVSKHLAQCCQQQNIQLFFISTDYVFDGNNAPYEENAQTSPLNFYGQSKSQAEQAVLAISNQHTIIRVPVLYGDVEYLAESAVTVIAEQIKAEQESKHDDWAIRYPTHVEDIALSIADLINLPLNQCHGIYHVSDKQRMTKYQIAQLLASAVNLEGKQLVALPTPTQTANRPYDCALSDTRLKQLGINHTRNFKQAITEVLKPHLP